MELIEKTHEHNNITQFKLQTKSKTPSRDQEKENFTTFIMKTMNPIILSNDIPIQSSTFVSKFDNQTLWNSLKQIESQRTKQLMNNNTLEKGHSQLTLNVNFPKELNLSQPSDSQIQLSSKHKPVSPLSQLKELSMDEKDEEKEKYSDLKNWNRVQFQSSSDPLEKEVINNHIDSNIVNNILIDIDAILPESQIQVLNINEESISKDGSIDALKLLEFMPEDLPIDSNVYSPKNEQFAMKADNISPSCTNEEDDIDDSARNPLPNTDIDDGAQNQFDSLEISLNTIIQEQSALQENQAVSPLNPSSPVADDVVLDTFAPKSILIDPQLNENRAEFFLSPNLKSEKSLDLVPNPAEMALNDSKSTSIEPIAEVTHSPIIPAKMESLYVSQSSQIRASIELHVNTESSPLKLKSSLKKNSNSLKEQFSTEYSAKSEDNNFKLNHTPPGSKLNKTSAVDENHSLAIINSGPITFNTVKESEFKNTNIARGKNILETMFKPLPLDSLIETELASISMTLKLTPEEAHAYGLDLYASERKMSKEIKRTHTRSSSIQKNQHDDDSQRNEYSTIESFNNEFLKAQDLLASINSMHENNKQKYNESSDYENIDNESMIAEELSRAHSREIHEKKPLTKSGWEQYSDKTLDLLRKKTMRVEKLQALSQERKKMKG